ncbi:hypothetical protein [Paraburkholderia hospita]|uniref:hypothetical protein n=1 Tax=Paraburkholderia hospita TaxID=169430 RepID=UPI003ECF311F
MAKTVVRVIFRNRGKLEELGYSAEQKTPGGPWTWLPNTPYAEIKRVLRLEVYRRDEVEPCLAFNVIENESAVQLVSGAIVFNVAVYCPAFVSDIHSEQKGTFKLCATVSPVIYASKTGDPLWTKFEAKDYGPEPTGEEPWPLSQIQSDSTIRLRGHQDVNSRTLSACLPFKNGGPDPGPGHIDLLLRRDRIPNRTNDVYILGFKPRFRYQSRLVINEIVLTGLPVVTNEGTEVEWIQPSDYVRKVPLTDPFSDFTWLAWLQGLQGDDIARLWNAHVYAPYKYALESVAGGEDATLAPELKGVQSGRVSLGGGLALGISMTFKADKSSKQLHAELLSVEPKDPPQSTATLGIRLSGLALLDGDGAITYGAVTRDPFNDPSYAESEIESKYMAKPVGRPVPGAVRFLLVTDRARVRSSPGQIQQTRFGAVDFGVANDDLIDFVIKAFVLPMSVPLQDPPPDVVHPRVLALSVRADNADLSDVRPGAEDPLPNASRASLDIASADPVESRLREALVAPPAVILQAVATDTTTSRAIADLQEESSPGRDRSLVIRLRNSGYEDKADRSIIYIGREPLLIAKVIVPSLVSRTADADEVGNWSLSDLEGNRWELASAGEGFRLIMPPQAVGEAMEKSKDQPSIEEGKPADFRLSAPGVFDLRSAYFNQRYAEAPWNLSRVLGYPGQRAPGATVDRLCFELVYGLSTEVDASKSPNRLALAELSSRIGSPAANVERALLNGKGFVTHDPRRDIFFWHRSRWVEILALYRGRLAVLQLYSTGDNPVATHSHTPEDKSNTVDVGVTVSLRQKADILYPIPKERRLSAPRPPRMPECHFDEKQNAGALAGGYAWPFEMDSLYRGLWRDPVSNLASISGLHFSSIGAWGEQRASFDNKRTNIISTTVMGRLSRLTVERVGRIGVLWNRSRHVIVYERTTLASQQFASSQQSLSKRPVLRKVAEYVDVLQAERTYPEFGSAPKCRGFVEAVRFASRRILVDSANWGIEGPTGIEIPLWNPSADPRVYLRPSIHLRTSGDKQGIADQVPREISEPDRLFFYSATAPDLDDRTDLWPPAIDVDYSDLPVPQPAQEDAIDPHDADAMLPPVLHDLPGWRRFTWPLVDTALRTNLVSERTTASAMNATLTNVSMMRSGGETRAATSPASSALSLASSSGELIARIQQNVASVIASGASGDAVRALILKQFDSAARVLQSTSADSKNASVFLTQEVVQGLGNDPSTRAAVQVVATLTPHLAQQRQYTTDWVQAWVTSAQAECGAISQVLTPEGARDLIETWQSKLNVGLGPFKTGLEHLLVVIDGLVSSLTAAYDEASDAFDEIVGPLADASFSASFGITFLEDAQAQVADAFAELARCLPTEVPPLLQGAVATARSSLESIGSALNKAIDDQIEKLEMQTEDSIDPIFDSVILPLRELIFDPERSGSPSLRSPITTLQGAATALKSAIDQIITQCPSVGEYIASALKDLIAKSVLDPGQLRTEIGKMGATTVDDLKKFDEALTKIVGDGKSFVTGQLGWTKKLPDLLKSWDGLEGKVGAWRNDLASSTRDVEDWWRGVGEPQVRQTLGDIDALYGRARAGLADLGKSPVFQEASDTLRLLRAVGEGPILPEMTFNRDRIAYFFDDYASAVRCSPTAALVNRVGDDLKALGIRVPTQELLDRVIPDSLPNFSLGTIFPDFAALKNSALFERLKLPQIANDKVRITHGVDQDSRMPYLKANVDLPIDERSEVFAVGPLGVVLTRALLHAEALIKPVKGVPAKTTSAFINADWSLEFGGTPLVTFEQTKLTFDEGGRMRFNIRPDQIRMDAALQWLTDLMREYASDSGDGLTIAMVERDGQPVGVTCSLQTTLPPLGAGVFAISGVQMGAGLELTTDEVSGEFAIGVKFNLSRKQLPFTLTIAFLNGGGWVETGARYLTQSRQVVSDVSIGIVAGAGVEFALGPCAGSVYAQFGVFVEFHTQRDGPTRLSIGIMLLVRGSVVVFGIATVGLTLLLQAIYRETGSMTGYGSLSVSIKVSEFFKLKFSSQVTYQLAGSGSGAKALFTAMASKGVAGVDLPPRVKVALAIAARRATLFQ